MRSFLHLLIIMLLLPFHIRCGDSACKSVNNETQREEQCEHHPFGRAPWCDGIEEPQTYEGCMGVLRANEGICVMDFIACREAIREAACDVCPPECADVEGAC